MAELQILTPPAFCDVPNQLLDRLFSDAAVDRDFEMEGASPEFCESGRSSGTHSEKLVDLADVALVDFRDQGGCGIGRVHGDVAVWIHDIADPGKSKRPS